MTEEKKDDSVFELGNTKIYVSSQILRYCSIRRLIQIGCFNSRTEDQVHLASQPGPLKQICSNHFLQYLKWRDIDKDNPWFRKEGDVKLDCVSDIIPNFLSFIEKEAKLNPVTLVFYSTAEYHELAYILKLNKQFQDDFTKNVKSIVIYEYYKYKGSEKSNFQAIDVLLDVKIRVYSCDKLAELLRQLFVGSKKKEEDYFPLKPDFEKIPINIKVHYPRQLWNMQPKYLLLSSVRVNFGRQDWKEEGSPLPREAYKKVVSMLGSSNKHCVSAFRNGMFRCNQPVIVKFKDLKEDTKSISYKGNIMESYLADGTCSLYTYNTVQFGIVVFKYDNQAKHCTDEGDLDYVQYKGVVDNELDVQAKVLDQDQHILQFTEKNDDDLCVKKDAQKFDLIVADILDRKNNVTIRKNMLKSVLVRLLPAGVGTGETKDDTTVSVDAVFMATYSSFQYKGLKIVNQIFCPVKDNSNLVRLVLTSTEADFMLEGGNSIGLATPINQSNFSECLIQAFQHELDVTEFIIDAIKKRSEEDRDYLSKQKSNKRTHPDLKHIFSNKKKSNMDKRDQIYDKRDELYDNRDRRDDIYGSRDEIYGSRDEIYGSRDEIYGSRDEIYGSRDEIYGSRDEIYGSRDELYGSVDQEVNLSQLGARRKDIGNDHDSRRRDNRTDRDVRRRENSNDHGDRSRDFEKFINEKRRDNDPTGKDDWHHRGEQGRERNRTATRGDYERDQWKNTQQDYTPDRRNKEHYDNSSRSNQDSRRQQYNSSEQPAPPVNNFSQPPPLLGSEYIEDIGERRY